MQLRFDSNGLIDLGWAARAQSQGLINFGRPLHEDAEAHADNALPLARDLNFVLQTVRDTYRPLKWAQVLRTVSVPDWAERWEVSKITGTGSINLLSHLQNSDFLQADFSKTSRTGVMYELGNGYHYGVREMVRWARLGLNPQVERAVIQAQAADEFLDRFMCTGQVAEGATAIQKGFATQTPSTDIPALVVGSTKASTTTSWTTAVAADYPLILDDLHKLTDAVYTNSKERRYADTIVMPLDEMQALGRIRASGFQDNVLTRFQSEWNAKIGRQGRMIVWDRLAALGTISSGPRIVAFDGTDDLVCAAVMGKPYGVDQILEVRRGFEAIATLVTGGFRTLDANGMVYLDIAA